MNDIKRVFVSIYCKIYTDSFSNEMHDKKATGKEIFEFLMKDARHCFDDSGQLISGDCNLWYLGCNEKFGELVLEDKVWKWSFGESSFDNVQAFVSMLYEKNLILKYQYQALMDKIAEGRLIDNMYDIKDYLICKREGRSWIKPENASAFRNEIKSFVNKTLSNMRERGYKIFN